MTKKWSMSVAKKLFYLPFMDLIYKAQTIHRKYFNANIIQISTLLNIKTGNCPEDCSYCSQSTHYKTSIKKESLMDLDKIMDAAKQAKQIGSTRFCIGAAWRTPRDKDLKIVCDIIPKLKSLGIEICATLGLLNEFQAKQLKEAGLDFYNHNIDTSPDFYSKIITTRKFEDRLATLDAVRKTGIKICCGGILGLGESNDDRITMLVLLANLKQPPESIPINKLIRVPGTPLANQEEIDAFDFIRTIALARILMPKSYIRLSAGREQMSDELQTLCFMGGANSIFYGEKLLTAKNQIPAKDDLLFNRLGLQKLVFKKMNKRANDDSLNMDQIEQDEYC